MTNKLIRQLARYIEDNFFSKPNISDGIYYCIESPKKIFNEVGKFLEHNSDTFAERLDRLMNERDMLPAEVYQKAGLDRRLFSKIRTIKDYMPSKRTVLLLAFALELDLAEAEDLLMRAGHALSPSIKEDIIIKFFLDKEIYDLVLLDEALIHYGFSALATKNL